MNTLATRRTLLSAALASAAAPAAMAGSADDLDRRYVQLVEGYNALPVDTPEADDEAMFDQLIGLEDEIARLPCRSIGVARAKLHQAIRGFEDGERGTEVESLQQVIAFLEAR